MNKQFTTDIINWDEIITIVGNTTGLTTVIDEELDEKFYNPRIKNFSSHTFESFPPSVFWIKPGYKFKNIFFSGLEAGQHFPKTLETTFSTVVNTRPLYSWISIVYPGYSIPIHIDEEPNEQLWKEQGLNLVRYSAFMHNPIPHQMFVLGSEYYYDTPKNTIIKWSDISLFHAGINCSTEPSYLYHFIGFEE
jgi:hypothetical protein